MGRDGKPEKMTSDKVTKVLVLTDEGCSRSTIAREVSCSIMTVWRCQKKYNKI